MRKRKTIISICAVVAMLSVVATGTFFAIFKNSKTNNKEIQTGTVDVRLVETFVDGNGSPAGGTDASGYGLQNATKTITGKNVGDQPAYVRVQLFPIVEYYYDLGREWKQCGINSNLVEYNISCQNWIDGGDGYLYYNKPVSAGGSTSTITINNLDLVLPDIIASEWKDYTLRVRMETILEATQSTNNLYKINWGIDNLPAGVY